MRTVAPIEYTVLCPNCKTRYACGITEYHQNLGNFFVCACGCQIALNDAELITWQTSVIKEGELVFKQLTYEE